MKKRYLNTFLNMYLKEILTLPSSISWCEKKYIYSEYIAEYWNSITGIFLCISAIYCMIKNDAENINVLYKSNILLFLVGVGTMLFHGTLIYFWQLFDEIPMLLIVIEYYKLLTTHIIFINHVDIFYIDYKLMYHMIPVIILSYYTYPSLQVIMFQGTLAIFIVLLLYSLYKINNNLNKLFYNKYKFNYTEKMIEDKYEDIESEYVRNLKKYRSKTWVSVNENMIDISDSVEKFKIYSQHKTLLKMYSRRGMFILIFSLLIWNIDNHFCEHVGYFQLHAIWHITTSIGVYYSNEIIKTYILIDKYI